MKKVLSVLLTVLLLVSSISAVVYADTTVKQEHKDEVIDVAKEKKKLRAKHIDKVKENMSIEAKNKRSDMIERTLNKLVSNGVPHEVVVSKMEKLGVYALDLPEGTSDSVTISSEGADMDMDKPYIYYDTFADRWYANGGGEWKNDNWFDDFTNVWWGYAGETKNVGNFDAFGITYFNTSGDYQTQVLSSSASWSDGNGWSSSSSSPSHGDGKNGVAFEFQDKVKLKPNHGSTIDKSDVTYLGKHFSTTITYDSDFVNYDGYARSFYIHTWESAEITSITFGVSGKAFGLDATIANRSQSFTAFNDRDEPF